MSAQHDPDSVSQWQAEFRALRTTTDRPEPAGDTLAEVIDLAAYRLAKEAQS